MIVKLGRYHFEKNEASVSMNKRGLVGDTGLIYAWEHTWDISGRLIRDSVAELTYAIYELDHACQNIDGDVRVLFDNGSTTAHSIRIAKTLNGIRAVRPPSYPISEGAEYVTYRTFHLTIQAEIGFSPGSGSAAAIIQGETVSWNQRVTVGGGLPVKVTLIPINKGPIQQSVAPQGPYVGVQSGESVGLNGYLGAPAVIFPDEMVVANDVTHATPVAAGIEGNSSRWPVQWSYRAVSTSPLLGRPPKR